MIGWNDGEVIAYLLVVEDSLVIGIDPSVFNDFGGEGSEFPAYVGKDTLTGFCVILRQSLRIRPRISNYFVTFVQGLGDLQGSVGGVAQLGIGFSLERRQVEEATGQPWRTLFGFGNRGFGLAGKSLVEILCCVFFPMPIYAVMRVGFVLFETFL